jgi:hypothetical protein
VNKCKHTRFTLVPSLATCPHFATRHSHACKHFARSAPSRPCVQVLCLICNLCVTSLPVKTTCDDTLADLFFFAVSFTRPTTLAHTPSPRHHIPVLTFTSSLIHTTHIHIHIHIATPSQTQPLQLCTSKLKPQPPYPR